MYILFYISFNRIQNTQNTYFQPIILFIFNSQTQASFFMNTSKGLYLIPNLNILQNGLYNQSIHKRSTQFKKFHKAIVISLFFGFFITYRLLYRQSSHKNCVVDNSHQWTFTLNRWIAKHAAYYFIGLGQIMMDINITFMVFHWYFVVYIRILCVKNFRLTIVTALFQYSRKIMLNIMTMPFQSYVIWFIPGFPSLTVSYDHTSDYYFSGHTGTLVILYLEAKNLNLPKIIQVYFIFTFIYMVFMLLVARVHYTIDIVGGVIYSIVFYRLVEEKLIFFDQLVNAPYKVFNMVKQRVRKKLLQNQEEGTSLFEIQHS